MIHINFAETLGAAAPSGVGVMTVSFAGSGALDKVLGDVTSVPEPASLVLFEAGLLSAGGIGFWRRRRR